MARTSTGAGRKTRRVAVRRFITFIWAVALALLVSTGPVSAEVDSGRDTAAACALVLTVHVDDPLGDQSGPVDVATMDLDFDPATGEYSIFIRADDAAPFSGEFRVNINLFNVDAPSVFSDVFNDYTLTSAQTELVLSGQSGVLMDWEVDDRVYTNSLAGTPNPPGTTLFRSGVSGIPVEFLTNEDVIAFSDLSQPAVVEVLTDQVRLERLILDIADLEASQVLSGGQAGSLQNKLEAVIAKLDGGQDIAAANQLGAFIHQVQGIAEPGGSADPGLTTLLDGVIEVAGRLANC
jgi:hypothetical protein